MLNISSLAIACQSHKKWDRAKTSADFIEYQALKLRQTGRLITQSMTILTNSDGSATVITAITVIKTTAQAVLKNLAKLLELGRSLPLMPTNCDNNKKSIEYTTLPDYHNPNKEPSTVEIYAQRLRDDRWDVRRLGEPQEWRLVRQ